ncbi:hypothetical protein [Carnobacterium viridans]|uniref:hypothetical protein n=1 Tax=Carnobacterium viridans TaxID=174587 RepID=UPI000B218F9E|nr:hypothetical protein [Carnobacterium viridans]
MIYSEYEPEGDYNEGDVWFDNKGGMFIWNEESANWIPHPFNNRMDAIGQEVKAAIEQADLDRTKAERDFESAKQEAKQYTEAKAQEFDNQLLIVNQNVLTATNSANAAVLKADKAIEDAGFMRVDVDAAKVNAIDALTKAQSATDNVNSLTTSYDALTQTVGFKAERTQVNAISGVVDQHELKISANSTAIAARLTSAQVDSLVAAKKYVNETTLNATANGLSTLITQVVQI